MSGLTRVGDLEVSQDLEFQRRSWRIQRVGWVIMALVALAALLGFLGHGPFSGATAGDDGSGMQISYARFVRHRSDTQIALKLQPGAVPGDQVRISLDNEFLDGIESQNIIPEPDAVLAGQDTTVYVFQLAEPGQAASITFDYLPIEIGARRVVVGLGDQEALTFTQLVYP